MINPHTISQDESSKEELADKEATATNKFKMINLNVNFRSNVNGVIEEIADRGNVYTAAFGETLATWPEELNEGEFIDIDDESGCNEKDEDIPDKRMQAKNVTLTSLQRYS